MGSEDLLEREAGSDADRRTILKRFSTVAAAWVAESCALTFSAFAAAPARQDWRRCSKCEGMFYAKASSGKGVCPADRKPHSDLDSDEYFQLAGDDIPKLQQGGWRRCAKCEGMFYGLGETSLCPAGAAHKDAGGNYAIPLGEDAPGRQGGWRLCAKCQGLFYAVDAAGLGVCPGGGAHADAGSRHYVQLTLD